MKKWLPVAVWMAAILIFSTMHVSPDLEPEVPNMGHFFEYAILGWLLYRALSDNSLANLRRSVYAVTAATLYGIAMEIMQLFIPYRQFSILDMLVNLAGATAAVIIIWLVATQRQLLS